MIELRPHHLLCTQGYSGKGYSDGFVKNMDKVVDYLRNNETATVRLVFSTDSLCSSCPNKKAENVCNTQEQVHRFDSKTVEYFGLEEKDYNYRDITAYIDERMTEDMLYDICGDCSWFSKSACRKNICKSRSGIN